MKNRKNTTTGLIATILFIVAMTACTNKKGPDEVAATVSFKTDIIPIFKTSCAINSSCHSGTSNTGDNYDFDSSVAYTTITGKQLIVTGTPTESLLYVEVSTGTMPKAPYSPLSSSQVALILNWIKQGAQNN